MQICRTIAILSLFLFAFPAVAADAPEERALELRKQAQVLIEKEKPEAALPLLNQARLEAQRVHDRYGRMNALRYVAEDYAQMHADDQARSTFGEAMKVALTVEPWYRRLSAVIGVVELEHAAGDLAGTREHAMQAIEARLLEQVADTGETGETRRFLASLDGVLNYADLKTILMHLRGIEQEGYRRVALSGLAELTYLPDDGKTRSRAMIEKPAASAKALEMVLWHVLLSRIARDKGNHALADRQAALAEAALPDLKTNQRKMREFVEKAKEKAPKAAKSH